MSNEINSLFCHKVVIMLKLTLITPHQLEQRTFFQDTLIVGKLHTADICIDHPHLQEKHLKIANEEGGCFVHNLVNDPQTLLNGNPFEKRKLCEGDIIQFHEISLIVNKLPQRDLLTQFASEKRSPITSEMRLEEVAPLLDRRIEYLKTLDEEWSEELTEEEKEILYENVELFDERADLERIYNLDTMQENPFFSPASNKETLKEDKAKKMVEKWLLIDLNKQRKKRSKKLGLYIFFLLTIFILLALFFQVI